MSKNISVSNPKIGMVKDKGMYDLQPYEYSHAKNTNIEGEDADSFRLTNAHSNLLANRFKKNYKVIGVKNDLFSNKVYYFLVNPDDNYSEIGYIENKSVLPDLGDTLISCGDCEYQVDLSAPLEEQEQQETQVYTTLLNDSCNRCLGFNINYPIKSIEIKNEKCGRVMYFTDNLNPPRYIELDNIGKYEYTGEELCGDDSNVIDTCVACEKMRIFKRSKIFNIIPAKIVIGGNLKRGTYEFLGAYSDESGNELSRYFSITNPISIFDKDNNILQQNEISDETNFAIKLNVQGLDLRYTHYKIAVVQVTDIGQSTSYFIEGVHSTSDNTIIYTTDKDKQRTTLANLTVPSTRVEKWKFLTASNGYLFGGGVTRPKQLNLQPVVNLIGVFLNWQSYVAKESLYEDGIASSKYKGYYREETYPLGIRFLLDGEYSPVFPFIGRPMKEGEDEIITNNDGISASKLSGSCIGTEFNKRWQIYDTSQELGSCPLSEEIQTVEVTEESEKICYVEPHKQTYIILDGEEGTAIITIDSANYSFDFTTNLDTTATNFKNDHEAAILSNHNLIVTTYNNIIILDGDGGDYDSVTITTEQGVLSGQVRTNDYLDKETNGSFSIPLSESDQYIDLKTYIEDNKSACYGNLNIYPFCEILNLEEYELDSCETSLNYDPDACENITLIGEEIEVVDVVGENTHKIEKSFPEDYSIVPPPQNCNIHEIDFTNGKKAVDEQFTAGWMYDYTKIGVRIYRGAYNRAYYSVNENCSYAESIMRYSPTTQFINGYFHNYFGSDIAEDLSPDSDKIATLQTQYKASYTDGNPTDENGQFTDKIHKGALWFKADTQDNEKKFILQITPQISPSGRDWVSENIRANTSTNTEVRVSIFKDCNESVTALWGGRVDLNDGAMFLMEIDNEGRLYMTTETGTKTQITQSGQPLTTDEFYVAIDVPIVTARGIEDPFDEDSNPQGDPLFDRYRTMPTEGCFGVVKSNILYDRVDVDFANILIRKKETYNATCTYKVPVLNDCEAYPNKFGEFSYTESTEEYPDNKDLYDSSDLKIHPSDIPSGEYFTGTTFRGWFEDKYTQDYFDEQGNYIWKTDAEGKPITDYRCKPIRHFKMPSNQTSPFMYDKKMLGFAESIIYPLGLTINESLINSFLEIAVKNGLITQEQRDTITGYEIVRGDRTANESIVAKGVTFDMLQYKDKNKNILYANYPFNDLGPDRLNYKDENRYSYVPHPYNSEKNNRWTFHSPDTDYYTKPSASFLKVDGYLFGKSKGNFGEVRDHPKWVILGDKLENLADTLAIAEVAAEALIKISEMISRQWFVGGMAFGASLGGIAAGAVAVIEIASSVLFKYARYRYEWLNTFKNLGAPKNFASYYAAEGFYNYFTPNTAEDEGNMFRYLNNAKNIKNGRLILTDSVDGAQIEINHIDREKTILLNVGSTENDFIEYDENYINYDNSEIDFNESSRTFASENNACEKGISKDIFRNVASMYVTLKNNLPSQYGEVGSIRWLTTGYRGDLKNPQTSCLGIFGGDVYITRHTLKRSMPLFVTTAMNQASLTPFEYKRYSNIGKEPRFYVDYEINNISSSVGRPIPSLKSEYNFDCFSGNGGQYVKPPSKFYLYYHGIPNFLTETTVNTNNRYAKPEPWNNFYPNTGDLMEWTQEVINPIRRGNTFFYNNVYSKNVTQTATLTLPVNYDKEEYDCKTDSPNGVMYSGQDLSENSYINPWLIFKPLDFYEFDAKYGEFMGLQGIETQQVLARFKNTSVIFNAVDTLVDDGTNPQTAELGTGGIFARRPRTFSNTDLGYLGTQTQSMVSCEYGHFFVDADRGQVFKINTGGQGFEEISSLVNGKPSGMEKWFKKHLPFKIKEYFPDFDIDNPYNNVGITMGWDSFYKRIFITKKDYIPDSTEYCIKDGIMYNISDEITQPIIDSYVQNGYTYEGIEDCKLRFTKSTLEEGVVFVDLPTADITDFKDVSWTISFNVKSGSWGSFFDFKPNYYVSHNGYFQTGINSTNDPTEFGVWSHLLTNKSYNVFYGKAYDWEIEIPVPNKGASKYLETFSYDLDVRRYHNDYDYAENKYIGFEEAMIWNNSNNSGKLKLDLQRTLSQLSKYPKTQGDTQTILQSSQDSVFTFNYFYNRVKNDKSGLPLFTWDENQIEKQLNAQAVSFYNKRVLERLKGAVFLINLKSSETQHKKIFKIAKTKENLYDR